MVIVIIPLANPRSIKLTDWNGFDQTYNRVGLDNFAKIVQDELFANAIKNTAIWMVAAISNLPS